MTTDTSVQSSSIAAQEAAAARAREEAAQRAREEAAQRAREEAAAQKSREETALNSTSLSGKNADTIPLQNFAERSGIEPQNARGLFEIKQQNNLSGATPAELRSSVEPVLDYRAATTNAGQKTEKKPDNKPPLLDTVVGFLGKAYQGFKNFVESAPPPPPAPERILELAQRGDAASATDYLSDELEQITGADAAAKRLELLNDPKVQEALRTIGTQVTTGADVDGDDRDRVLEERQHQLSETYTNLTRAGELAGADGAQILAQNFAQGANQSPQSMWETNQLNTNTSSTTKDAINSAVRNGDGTAFVTNLAIELDKANKPGGATVAQELQRAMSDLKVDFDEKAEKVNELNAKLSDMLSLSGLSPTDPRAQTAINNFLADHQEDFDDYEEAGRKLSSTLSGANVIINRQAELPPTLPPFEDEQFLLDDAKRITSAETIAALGQTKAGQAVIADALEQQGEDKSTFLDLIPQQLENVDTFNSHAATLSNVLTKSAGARIMKLAAEPGREREASKLLRGLIKNHDVFGLDRSEMNGLAGDMRKVLTSPPNSLAKQTAVESLNNRLSGIEGKTPGVNRVPGAAGALKGLGFIVSLAGQADAISNFSQQDLAEKVRTVAGGVGLTADGASTALQIFGADNSATAKFFGRIAPGVSGITAVLDGFAAVKSITEGDYAGAALNGASAVGGGILVANALRLAAGSQALPVAGQLIGLALTVGAVAGGFIKGKIDEGNLEEEYEKFLNDTGLKPEFSDRFSDVDDGKNIAQFVGRTAAQLGISPRDLVEQLQNLSNDEIEKVVEMAHNLETNDDGVIEQTADNDADIGENIDRGFWFDGTEEPKSITGAANWLQQRGYVS